MREECFCISTPPLAPIDYLPFSFAVLARDLFRFILSLLPFLFLFLLSALTAHIAFAIQLRAWNFETWE